MSLVDLVATYGPLADGGGIAERDLDAARVTAPTPLVELLAAAGEGGIAGGLFWLLNPKTAAPALAEWLARPHEATAFLRSAFGEIYFWHTTGVSRISVHTGRLQEITGSIERFFRDFLAHPVVQRDVFRKALVAEATARLGPLSRREAFAFDPALALAHPPGQRHVVKVDWLEHSAFLAGLASSHPRESAA